MMIPSFFRETALNSAKGTYAALPFGIPSCCTPGCGALGIGGYIDFEALSASKSSDKIWML
jgi:hypothetical protein